MIMRCGLCGTDAVLVHKGLTGYQAPARFDVYDCRGCGSQFSWPMAPAEALYENIYRNIRNVPGYSRYLLYSENIKKAASPLDYLADKEESYWATAAYLRGLKKEGGRRISVLDVGSGMGYLTYALHSDGFAVKGLDVSEKAVKLAEASFGGLFTCSTLEALVESGPTFDVLVLNQMIEHAADPAPLLQSAVKLLAPGGKILITTPNRSFSPEGAVWETDLPPVHRWWFSEKSFEYAAGVLDCEVEFFDFSSFYASHYVRVSRAMIPGLNAKRSFLDAAGEPVPGVFTRPRDWWLERISEKLGFAGGYRAARDLLSGEARFSGARGPVCCAILSRRKAAQPVT